MHAYMLSVVLVPLFLLWIDILTHVYTQESRTKKVAELVAQLHSSSLVLGMDPTEANSVVHVGADGAQVQPGDISDGAIAGLAAGIERLREIKRSRMEKVRTVAFNLPASSPTAG
jgi:hypothetical protein